jgi:hypothetical protein
MKPGCNRAWARSCGSYFLRLERRPPPWRNWPAAVSGRHPVSRRLSERARRALPRFGRRTEAGCGVAALPPRHGAVLPGAARVDRARAAVELDHRQMDRSAPRIGRASRSEAGDGQTGGRPGLAEHFSTRSIRSVSAATTSDDDTADPAQRWLAGYSFSPQVRAARAAAGRAALPAGGWPAAHLPWPPKAQPDRQDR